MVKPYEQYLAEDLAGEYCYYGPGSLLPLVTKLAGEGKDAAFVYRYLTSLGVDEARKRNVISQVYADVFEGQVFEGQVFEDEVDDLLSAEVEDELSGKKKGKGDDEEEDRDKEDEDEEDEEDEDEEDEDEEDKPKDSDQTAVLKRVLKDQGKLDKIRAILKESLLPIATAELDEAGVRLAEAAARSQMSMGGRDREFQMFCWSNGNEGTFLSVGADDKEALKKLSEALGIKEYYIYRKGYANLTQEGGGAEYLEQWSGPDHSFVSKYPGALAKRTTA